MKTSLSEDSVSATVERLRSSNRNFMARYPGEEGRRQPVHPVYGGAHLFRADSARPLGQVAETSLAEYAPDFVVVPLAIGLPFAQQVALAPGYAKALNKRSQADGNP